MQSRIWVPVMSLASTFMLQATASYGQETIGKMTSVRSEAEGIHSGSTRTLSGVSDVYSKETVRIRTGDTGHANLQFHDDIDLSVGPKSSVHLDKYVYDRNKSAGTIAVQATRGSLRFATASQGGGSYQIKTPYGTLGYRSIEECRPNVISGNHGFCNPSPSRQVSHAIAKSEKAIAVKKESPRYRANAITAIKTTTVKPKAVAMAAKPTVATPRTGPAEEKADFRTIIEPDVTASVQPSETPIPVPNKATTTIGGRAVTPTSPQLSNESDKDKIASLIATVPESSATSPQPSENLKSIVGSSTNVATSGQASEASDPVLEKAEKTVAGKMENPASAEFEDMTRAIRKDPFGQSIDTICGHVRGKRISGVETGKRAFLYLVKEDIAFVDYGVAGSVAANAYRIVCTSGGLNSAVGP
jgi:hypothetical protein